MLRLILFLFVVLTSFNAYSVEVVAGFHKQHFSLIPYFEKQSIDKTYYLTCVYKYNGELFKFKFPINNSMYLNGAVYGKKICKDEVKVKLRHEILGSSVGYSRDKVNVIRDIKAGGLRVRQSRMDGCDFIEVDGVIDSDAVDILTALIPKIKTCKSKTGNNVSTNIFLNSFGGYVSDGMRLGKLLRDNHFTTLVVQDQLCASSCAIAFLGGYYRKMDGGRLLLHAPYIKNLQGYICSGPVEMNKLKKYYEAMLSSSASKIAFERTARYCDPNGGWIVNATAAELFGITTQ
ncbi:hypothetical protein [Marinospirillum insulare]|uniref:ATP-dependent Clp protease proteolytic subunit n=1 Tax=Marinospirillum insulare TaxID=217169 RepID=A0ABQ6A4P6_9GAMM|nr:hypothetical protein [Marinospirillum insulare]GLR65060.1 hypothetical protein GCM10007878_24990 [Marinospirillum insulare]